MYDIAVIGSGGIGSNLACCLVKSGYDVTLYDSDTIDEKFMRRFLFHNEELILWNGVPKVNLVKHVCPHIYTINEMYVDQDISIINMVIIATDRIDNRTKIEKAVRKQGIPFIHIGCNLDSIEIWPTMQTVIGEDRDPSLSSYDREPDARTYLKACVEMLEYLQKRRELPIANVTYGGEYNGESL